MIGGNIILQYPLGWLADRVDRERLLTACGLGFTLAALLLPWLAGSTLLWPVLALLGISAGGIYTLALIIVGQRFQGIDLVTANAAFGVLWGLGSLTGPLFAGLGMAALEPNGLPLTWASLGVIFLLLLWRKR
jgi:MFS family permease